MFCAPVIGAPQSAGSEDRLEVFTTRPDTLFGATYMVIAPEHPQLRKLTTAESQERVQAYVEAAASKTDLERTELQKKKSGVFTGLRDSFHLTCHLLHPGHMMSSNWTRHILCLAFLFNVDFGISECTEIATD